MLTNWSRQTLGISWRLFLVRLPHECQRNPLLKASCPAQQKRQLQNPIHITTWYLYDILPYTKCLLYASLMIPGNFWNTRRVACVSDDARDIHNKHFLGRGVTNDLRIIPLFQTFVACITYDPKGSSRILMKGRLHRLVFQESPKFTSCNAWTIYGQIMSLKYALWLPSWVMILKNNPYMDSYVLI